MKDLKLSFDIYENVSKFIFFILLIICTFIYSKYLYKKYINQKNIKYNFYKNLYDQHKKKQESIYNYKLNKLKKIEQEIELFTQKINNILNTNIEPKLKNKKNLYINKDILEIIKNIL